MGRKAGEAAARRAVAVKTYSTEEKAISDMFLGVAVGCSVCVACGPPVGSHR